MMKNEPILAAALMSAVLPGSGHMWLGRRRLGAIELAGGLAILCAGVYRMVAAGLAALRAGAPTSDVTMVITKTCIPWAAALVAYSLLDGAFTYLVSRTLAARGPGFPEDR